MLHFIIEISNFTSFISFIIRELKINGFDINSAIVYIISVLKTLV